LEHLNALGGARSTPEYSSLSGRSIRRKSRLSAQKTENHPSEPSQLSSTLASRFTARLPYASIEAASASLHAHLLTANSSAIEAHDRCCTPKRFDSIRTGPDAVLAFDFICIRLFPIPFVARGAIHTRDPAVDDDADQGDIVRRSLAARQMAEEPLRRLLGLAVSAPRDFKGRAPKNQAVIKANAMVAPTRVTLRCVDVKPDFMHNLDAASFCTEILDGAAHRCNSTLPLLCSRLLLCLRFVISPSVLLPTCAQDACGRQCFPIRRILQFGI